MSQVKFDFMLMMLCLTQIFTPWRTAINYNVILTPNTVGTKVAYDL